MGWSTAVSFSFSPSFPGSLDTPGEVTSLLRRFHRKPLGFKLCISVHIKLDFSIRGATVQLVRPPQRADRKVVSSLRCPTLLYSLLLNTQGFLAGGHGNLCLLCSLISVD